MMRKKLETYLSKIGFFPLTSSVSDISALVKFENNLLNILQIIDYKSDLYLDSAQYEEIKASLRGAFKDKGVSEIHILTLILAEDLEKAVALGAEEPFCWCINKQTSNLIINEDKQPDFYGMKALIEEFLVKWKENPEGFDEEPIVEKTQISKRTILAEYFKKAPYVTLAMVIINLLLCFCCIANPVLFYGKGSTSLTYVREGEWYRLITAMFLHGGLDHYFSNMLLLYFMGEMLENRVGRVTFLFVYMASGIIGNLVSCLYEYYTGHYFVSFGASGAVFGIMGMLIYMVIMRRETIRIPIMSMVFMIGYCIYSSFVGEHINGAAHLGGLLGGMIVMFVLGLRRKSHEG